MVLAWHFVGVMVDPGAAPWEFATYHALRLGRTGVDLFFVLSGFLITGIVLDRQRPARQFLLSFYLRRSLRVLPPYIALVGTPYFSSQPLNSTVLCAECAGSLTRVRSRR